MSIDSKKTTELCYFSLKIQTPQIKGTVSENNKLIIAGGKETNATSVTSPIRLPNAKSITNCACKGSFIGKEYIHTVYTDYISSI